MTTATIERPETLTIVKVTGQNFKDLLARDFVSRDRKAKATKATTKKTAKK
jgi:hypothetical protein